MGRYVPSTISFFSHKTKQGKAKEITRKSRVRSSTKKPRKAVCILMAAHSCLTTLKSLGGARTTVAIAALKASEGCGE